MYQTVSIWFRISIIWKLWYSDLWCVLVERYEEIHDMNANPINDSLMFVKSKCEISLSFCFSKSRMSLIDFRCFIHELYVCVFELCHRIFMYFYFVLFSVVFVVCVVCHFVSFFCRSLFFCFSNFYSSDRMRWIIFIAAYESRFWQWQEYIWIKTRRKY